MIIEGLVSTISARGEFHLAPMGPKVTGDFESLLLRPFEGSATLENFRRAGPQGSRAVFHLTDDVLLLAKAAIHQLDSPPLHTPTPSGKALRLTDCCRWFEIEVSAVRETPPRPALPRWELECQVIDQGAVRPWAGFNRARHAVLEAAIACTRIGILADAEIEAELGRLEIIVGKTAGPREFEAFALLRRHFETARG
jgi:hypothetical protein